MLGLYLSLPIFGIIQLAIGCWAGTHPAAYHPSLILAAVSAGALAWLALVVSPLGATLAGAVLVGTAGLWQMGFWLAKLARKRSDGAGRAA
jgi:hypothetical protein